MLQICHGLQGRKNKISYVMRKQEKTRLGYSYLNIKVSTQKIFLKSGQEITITTDKKL